MAGSCVPRQRRRDCLRRCDGASWASGCRLIVSKKEQPAGAQVRATSDRDLVQASADLFSTSKPRPRRQTCLSIIGQSLAHAEHHSDAQTLSRGAWTRAGVNASAARVNAGDTAPARRMPRHDPRAAEGPALAFPCQSESAVEPFHRPGRVFSAAATSDVIGPTRRSALCHRCQVIAHAGCPSSWSSGQNVGHSWRGSPCKAGAICGRRPDALFKTRGPQAIGGQALTARTVDAGVADRVASHTRPSVKAHIRSVWRITGGTVPAGRACPGRPGRIRAISDIQPERPPDCAALSPGIKAGLSSRGSATGRCVMRWSWASHPTISVTPSTCPGRCPIRRADARHETAWLQPLVTETATLRMSAVEDCMTRIRLVTDLARAIVSAR